MGAFAPLTWISTANRPKCFTRVVSPLTSPSTNRISLSDSITRAASSLFAKMALTLVRTSVVDTEPYMPVNSGLGVDLAAALNMSAASDAPRSFSGSSLVSGSMGWRKNSIVCGTKTETSSAERSGYTVSV